MKFSAAFLTGVFATALANPVGSQRRYCDLTFPNPDGAITSGGPCNGNEYDIKQLDGPAEKVKIECTGGNSTSTDITVRYTNGNIQDNKFLGNKYEMPVDFGVVESWSCKN